MYNAESRKVEKRSKSKGDTEKGIAQMGANAANAMIPPTGEGERHGISAGENGDEDEEPQLSLMTSLILLAGSTAFVALCAEYMVSSM